MFTTRQDRPAQTAAMSPKTAMALVMGSAAVWETGDGWPFFFQRFFILLARYVF
jgi:hypothetical protein